MDFVPQLVGWAVQHLYKQMEVEELDVLKDSLFEEVHNPEFLLDRASLKAY